MTVDEVRAAMLTNKMADQLREIARLEAEVARLESEKSKLLLDLMEYGDHQRDCPRWRWLWKQDPVRAACVCGFDNALVGEVDPDSGVVHKIAENGAETQIEPSADVEADQC